MTRKEALSYAISAINQLPQSDAGNEAILILTRISESCQYIEWTKEKVFEKLNQWKEEHGRNPTVADLSEPGMPKKATVKRLFNMNPSSFMNLYYPKEKRKPTAKYAGYTDDDYVAAFKVQYQKIKPKSSKEYDLFREPNTPMWLTVARHCGVTKWSDLLALTEVKRYGRVSDTGKSRSYKVCVSDPSFEKMVELMEERREFFARYDTYRTKHNKGRK